MVNTGKWVMGMSVRQKKKIIKNEKQNKIKKKIMSITMCVVYINLKLFHKFRKPIYLTSYDLV